MLNLNNELQRHILFKQQLLAEYPDVEEADLADTIEGATDLDQALIIALRDMRRDLYSVEAIERQIADLEERKKRKLARAERTKAIVLSTMERAGMRKLVAPDFVASVKPTPPAVIVTDGALVPDDYLVFPDPRVDKITVKKAIQEGFKVAGCELSNGGTALSIRS